MSEIEDAARKVAAVFTTGEGSWQEFETEWLHQNWPDLFDALQDLVEVLRPVAQAPPGNWIFYFNEARAHHDVAVEVTSLLSVYEMRVHNVNKPKLYPLTERAFRERSGGGDWLARISTPLPVDLSWLKLLLAEHGFELTAWSSPLENNPGALKVVQARFKEER